MRVGNTENMTVTPPRVMALYFKPADSKSMIPCAGAAADINQVRMSARQRSTLPSYDASEPMTHASSARSLILDVPEIATATREKLYGGRRGVRTPDPRIANAVLSQLS